MGPGNILRTCVAEEEQAAILGECHMSPYGENFAGKKTADTVLRSGFFPAHSIP